MKLSPALLPLVFAFLAAGLAARAHLTPPPPAPQNATSLPPEAPCPQPVLDLLEGLHPGDTLGDFEVKRISCGASRAVDLFLEGKAGKVTLNLVPRGALPHSPPTQTKRCDLFYSNHTPQPPFQLIQKAMEALAARVNRTETGGLPAGW